MTLVDQAIKGGTVVDAGCSREITETNDDNSKQTGSSNYIILM